MGSGMTSTLAHEPTTVALGARLEHARVLLAMSDSHARHALARGLRAEGYHVVEAANGLQLLERLASGMVATRGRSLPDIVVTDADMGGLAGLDVLVGMRRTLVGVALVVLADPGDAQAHADAARAQASLVLDAPPTIIDLSRALRSLRAPTSWAPVLAVSAT